MIGQFFESAEQDVHRLVRMSQAGDAQAFDELVARYIDRIHRYVRSRVAPGDAEDLVQQVFAQMVEALPRYENRGLPFGAWLFKIARNVLIDADRQHRDDMPLDGVAELIMGGIEPSQVAEAAQRRRALAAAIRSLPPDQRDVITLRFYGDLPVRDVARLMGKRDGTVRVLQFRALKTLRQRLAPSTDLQLDRLHLGEVKA